MSQAILPGVRIDQYAVSEVLGSGSMGDVYLASDSSLGRHVALKILSEKHRQNQELRARFVREARAVAAISHPNVVQIYTTGVHDDRPYIAMELLDGIDLGSDVKTHGAWSSGHTIIAGLDAASGLSAAAKAGLIHRDVKPSNLVRLRDGTVKVTDFGLAKPVDTGNSPALTAAGVVVGTPDYIAPEQARGDDIDERVDIYALGGTLYYLMTGIPPFRTGKREQDKYLKVVARHLRSPVPDPRQRNPKCHAALAELMMAMMAKRADDRPTYMQVIEELTRMNEHLNGTRTLSRPPLEASATPYSSPTPFVGGSSPTADELRGATDSYDGQNIVDDDPAANIPTKVREVTTPPPIEAPSPHNLAMSTPSLIGPSLISNTEQKPRRRWFGTVVTLLSLGLFVAGLVLYLNRPTLQPHDNAPLPTQTLPPELPQGMVAVAGAHGKTRYISAKPISFAEYARIFPRHVPSGKSKSSRAATGISYGFAAAYAAASGGRLPSAQEWTELVAAPTVTTAGIDEWVQPVMNVIHMQSIRDDGTLQKSDGRGDPRIGFRIVIDSP